MQPSVRSASDQLALLSAVLTAAADAIFSSTLDGIIQTWNPAAENLLGYSHAEAVGMSVDRLVPDPKAGLLIALAGVVATGETHHAEGPWRHHDGRVVEVSWAAARLPISDDANEPGFAFIAHDISGRMAIIRYGEERIRDLFESVPNSVVTINEDGLIVYINDLATALFGYTRDEMLTMTVEDLVPERVGRDHHIDLRKGFAHGRGPHAMAPGRELHARHKSGLEIPVEIGLSSYMAADGQRLVTAVIADITERKVAAARLQETTARLEAVVDASPLSIGMFGFDGVIQYANRAAHLTFGWIEDGHRQIVQDIFEPGEFERLEAEVFGPRLRRGEVVAGFEAVATRADGTKIEVEIFAGPYRQDGEVVAIVAMFADITGRHIMERHLRQAQKLETVGRLAGGVAHDFNNILTAIGGHAALVRKRVGPAEQVSLDVILSATDRAAGLTRQLLTFSRQQAQTLQMLDLNVVVGDLAAVHGRLLDEGVLLDTVLQPVIGSIEADPTQIEQIFLNLVLNAQDAMPDGGRITIATSGAEFGSQAVIGGLEITPGRYVVMSVADTGTGMDEATRSRIFEPFFTTKPMGKGTGLGLATVYGIVRQSGGYIWVYSELGHGTTFKVYLPLVGDQPPAGQPKPEIATRGVLLLVEDDPLVREFEVAALREARFQVLVAGSAEEALATADATREPIDILVTDLVLPEIGGQELARRLRSQNPALPVLLISGYTEEAVHLAPDDLLMRFLAKPFSPEALVDAALVVLLASGSHTPSD